MRIAVSAAGPGPEAPAEERFGRCACFVIFDEQGNVEEVVDNAGKTAPEGAGVLSAQSLLRRKVSVVLTGRVGPKAMRALQAGGVAVYTGIAGTVAETLAKYKSGRMQPATPSAGSPGAGRRAGRRDG